MKKTYCDCCGKEILEYNILKGGVTHSRLGTSVKSKDGSHFLTVEVLTGLNRVSNAGDFCKYCVLDALYKLDDRKTYDD